MKIYLSIILLALLSNLAYSFDSEFFEEQLKLAQQGDAMAQSTLGILYDNGWGVPENDKTAVMWYTKAAEQGNARAQSVLGVKYANGEGVPENDVKAYVWVSMAKANGDEVAKVIIDVFKTEMTKEQIAKAQKLAAKCYASDYKDCN